MPHFRSNGLDMFYDLHGQGEPMLLVHGFSGTGQDHWQHQIPVFSERYRLIAPDVRGHGRTDHPETITGPPFFELATSDLVGLVSSLGLGPVHVCGFSMGSSLATCLYYARPSLVKSLVLVSGAARINREVGGGLFELWQRLGNPDAISPGWAKRLAALHGEQRWQVLLQNYSRAVIARFSQDEAILYRDAGEIRCPTLIVQGGRDLVSPTVLSEELHASIPDSELVILDCEHWVPGLRPQEFNEVVLDFLDRHFPAENPL